jgi:hypothetical protein
MHAYLIQTLCNIANYGYVLIFAAYPIGSMISYYNRRDRERANADATQSG